MMFVAAIEPQDKNQVYRKHFLKEKGKGCWQNYPSVSSKLSHQANKHIN